MVMVTVRPSLDEECRGEEPDEPTLHRNTERKGLTRRSADADKDEVSRAKIAVI